MINLIFSTSDHLSAFCVFFFYNFLAHLFGCLIIFIVFLEKSNLRTGDNMGIELIHGIGKFQLLKKSDHSVQGILWIPLIHGMSTLI